MRSMMAFTALFLAITSGCAPSSRGGAGQGGDVGGGSTGQNDNTSGPGGDSSNVNDNEGFPDGPATNDNSDDSGDLPVAFRLDGVWEDNGRVVIVEQNGVDVVGNYFSEVFCDLETGTVPVGEEPAPGAMLDSTFFDFRGTLNNGEEVLPGDVITGEVSTCRFGFESGNGIVLADLTLSVVDESTMSGEWQSDADGDGEPDFTGSILVTRQQ